MAKLQIDGVSGMWLDLKEAFLPIRGSAVKAKMVALIRLLQEPSWVCEVAIMQQWDLDEEDLIIFNSPQISHCCHRTITSRRMVGEKV